MSTYVPKAHLVNSIRAGSRSACGNKTVGRWRIIGRDIFTRHADMRCVACKNALKKNPRAFMTYAEAKQVSS